jgi:hypothetical protein
VVSVTRAPAGITSAGKGPFLRRTRAAAGGSFTPADIATLALWLKADGTLWQDSARTTPVASDADPVGAWDDESGNGRHYTQATGGNRPTFRTAVVNSEPVVRFAAGSAQWLGGPDFLTGFSAGEVVVVVKLNADPPFSDGGMWDFGSTADSEHYCYADGNIYEEFGTTSRKSTGNPTPALNSWRRYGVWSASGDFASYFDGASGSPHYSTGTNTVGWTTAPFLGKSNAGFYLDGDIAELVLSSAKLSSGDRSSLDSYLATKYGL